MMPTQDTKLAILSTITHKLFTMSPQDDGLLILPPTHSARVPVIPPIGLSAPSVPHIKTGSMSPPAPCHVSKSCRVSKTLEQRPKLPNSITHDSRRMCLRIPIQDTQQNDQDYQKRPRPTTNDQDYQKQRRLVFIYLSFNNRVNY